MNVSDSKSHSKPTITVILQYPNKPYKHTCTVTFDTDIEMAMLQATFALKEAVKEKDGHKESLEYDEEKNERNEEKEAIKVIREMRQDLIKEYVYKMVEKDLEEQYEKLDREEGGDDTI